jgi:hypothetical protein
MTLATRADFVTPPNVADASSTLGVTTRPGLDLNIGVWRETRVVLHCCSCSILYVFLRAAFIW